MTAPTQSPIDIDFFNPDDSKMKFPSYPKLALNLTYFRPINNISNCYLTVEGDCDSDKYYVLGLNAEGFGHAYFVYLNKTVVYTLKQVQLHIYSEHTFQDNKMDLEIQLIHKLEEEKTENKIVDLWLI